METLTLTPDIASLVPTFTRFQYLTLSEQIQFCVPPSPAGRSEGYQHLRGGIRLTSPRDKRSLSGATAPATSAVATRLLPQASICNMRIRENSRPSPSATQLSPVTFSLTPHP